MSLELKVSTTFKNSIDVVKDKVLSNLLEAKGQGKFNVEKKDFEIMCNLIIMSFDQGSINSFSQIDSLVKEIRKEYGN